MSNDIGIVLPPVFAALSARRDNRADIQATVPTPTAVIIGECRNVRVLAKTPKVTAKATSASVVTGRAPLVRTLINAQATKIAELSAELPIITSGLWASGLLITEIPGVSGEAHATVGRNADLMGSFKGVGATAVAHTNHLSRVRFQILRPTVRMRAEERKGASVDGEIRCPEVAVLAVSGCAGNVDVVLPWIVGETSAYPGDDTADISAVCSKPKAILGATVSTAHVFLEHVRGEVR